MFFRDGDDCPLLVALQPEVVLGGICLTVDARDEMVRLFHYGRGEAWDLALHLYLESGAKIWRTFRHVLTGHFGGLERVGSVLDFAAGYGRVTRFLVADLPPERVWVAEIDPGAVRFQETTFGVHGIVSSSRPEELALDPPERRFDAILVSSLFTHLPEASFRGWLDKLLDLLAPGGILALSVHDRSLLGGSEGQDFVFRPESETATLATAEYGSTWVSETFLRGCLEAIAPGATVRRVPRGLANYQDLYLVTRGAAVPEAKLPPRGGIESFIEGCHLAASRVLTVSGWVTDRHTRWPVQAVRATLDGVEHAVGLWERPEVAAVFPGDAASGQGWHAAIPLPLGCRMETATLRLVAVGDDGVEATLYSGTVQALLARTAAYAALNLGRENEDLKRRLAWMETSRFWKVRERWFAWKRWLGLAPR